MPGRKEKTECLGHALPNGCSLYWKDNAAGGRTYYSDEVGGGVEVWDTSLVDEGTLLFALAQERKLNIASYMERRRRERKNANPEAKRG